ncbi:NAD(P)H-binding protein [Planctomonas sp. JC2975]|uniref:NAD(P)-dependent oxidoreductase n=1 Tax=Planctomonas sp. JC2975 TaxID=2729626 RepID=UPI001475D19E|nr:NAD(P)H-binding protein [Planctomonas sp. JC2975]NNC13627.1 NAD(P)H-binding protein [Planctomonas sp. JC2975]
MHIGVIGGTGMIGSRVVTEAVDRGHRVTAYSRDASAIHDGRDNVEWKEVDVTDSENLRAVIAGLDLLVSAFGPGNTAADPERAVALGIADPGIYVRVAHALTIALCDFPRIRLIVVGGAASLEMEPGLVFQDSDELLHAAIDSFGLPPDYAAAMRGHGDALNVFRTSNRLWTYLSPAIETAPGERTGRYRSGGDQPVTDAEGRSRISAEDLAVAVLDEAEIPRYIQRRFTIGY